MKVITKKRDHSPINLNNEIHIKIDNDSDKKRSRYDNSYNNEERAIKRLNNMEYINNAIRSSTNSRVSGGSIILPPTYNKPLIGSQNQLGMNELLNQQNLIDTLKSIGSRTSLNKKQESAYSDPNAYSSSSGVNITPPIIEEPEQTAKIEFIDENDHELLKLPMYERNKIIEEIKRKRGRPKGIKNKKLSTHSLLDDTISNEVFSNEHAFKAISNNPDNKKQTSMDDFLKPKVLTMNQVPPRPDRNLENQGFPNLSLREL